MIHIETNPELYGYGNTLDILHDAVRKFLPTMDENNGGNRKDSYSRVSVKYKGIAMHTQSIKLNKRIIKIRKFNPIYNSL